MISTKIETIKKRGDMKKKCAIKGKVARMNHKQSNKDRMDESLGMRMGKESTKKQSMMDRRHESMGSKKKK
ncbi:MAG TPA: hypothetical protein VGF75_07080 [Candidatus Saccharimonadales bacterium]|jgi:hypothetical protein